MKQWYLVLTKPAHEDLAERNLQRQGYEVYLPRLLRPARGEKTHDRIVPLFPRYLFLHLHAGLQALAPVRSSIGVAGVVRFGSSYGIVPDGVIEDLRMREDPQTGLHALRDPPPPVPGSPVRVSGGPFDGLDAVFVRDAGAERVIVLLRLLGRETPVGISARFVSPAQESRLSC
jgi:transcriptional antiterminator RfaH